MDPSLLQLFTVNEILAQIGRRKLTGALHIYTLRESANIFFHEGTVIAAAKGLVEGVDVLKQVGEWREARAFWSAGTTTGGNNFKALKIPILEFLGSPATVAPAAVAPAPVVPEIVEKAAPEAREVPKATPRKPLVALGAGAKSAPTIPPVPAVAPAVKEPSQPVPAPRMTMNDPMAAKLTATKTITSTSQLRLAQEQALLSKHQLSLVGVETPEQRIKINRASTLIGRNPACDLTLDHGSISRQHCLMQLTDRGLHVKDLGTTNGTKVNGIAMTEGYINVGDKLTIGHVVFVLQRD